MTLQATGRLWVGLGRHIVLAASYSLPCLPVYVIVMLITGAKSVVAAGFTVTFVVSPEFVFREVVGDVARC